MELRPKRCSAKTTPAGKSELHRNRTQPSFLCLRLLTAQHIMQAAGTRGQRPRSQEAAAGCFPAVHPQRDEKWSGWGPQGRVRPRPEAGTPQLGRWADSPPPPFRKGLADTRLLVPPGPLPRQAEELSRSPCPSAPSSGSSTLPDFCPQSLPFSLDPRKGSRDNP